MRISAALQSPSPLLPRCYFYFLFGVTLTSGKYFIFRMISNILSMHNSWCLFHAYFMHISWCFYSCPNHAYFVMLLFMHNPWCFYSCPNHAYFVMLLFMPNPWCFHLCITRDAFRFSGTGWVIVRVMVTSLKNLCFLICGSSRWWGLCASLTLDTMTENSAPAEWGGAT